MSIGIEDKELHKIRQAFSSFDKDGNGAITLEEINKAFDSLHKHYSENNIKHVLAHVDLNQDGYITFHEFLSLYKRLLQKERQERKMKKAFQIFDSDNSGHISLNELKNVMEQVGGELNELELNQMLKKADVNGDTQIDYQEFIQLLKEKGILIN